MAQQQRNPGRDDVDSAVRELDLMRSTVFFRDPDRPDGRFVREHGQRRSVDVIRAQGRLRSARWRGELDRRRAATLEQIGKSLCVALVTSNLEELTDGERSLVGRMLANLQSRGFDLLQSRKTLRRLRNRLMDPADRQPARSRRRIQAAAYSARRRTCVRPACARPHGRGSRSDRGAL
jgi:hypothetical protein